MKRIQKIQIENDLKKKMVFLVGPRQVGKTWLAKKIAEGYDHPLYLNYDNSNDREIILGENWLPNTDLLILDEIHKLPDWKNYLKGVYDNKYKELAILVTGSARLDTFRQSGDSLAGRYFVHYLLPVSYRESFEDKKFTLDQIIVRGGFPEPLLAESDDEANRWRKFYIDIMIREDILDFENINEIRVMEVLVKMLRKRVASPLSYSSLANDLGKSPHTIKKYIRVLEALYIVFLVTPFSKNIARSIRKEPKLYFYDTGLVDGDSGVKFENQLAVSLYKHCLHQYCVSGKEIELHYLRTKEKREVDFCFSEDGELIQLIEAKSSDNSIDKNLIYFSERYKTNGVQVVRYLRKERTLGNISVVKAENFLLSLEI